VQSGPSRPYYDSGCDHLPRSVAAVLSDIATARVVRSGACTAGIISDVPYMAPGFTDARSITQTGLHWGADLLYAVVEEFCR
jgi:hypothetical protein